MKKILFAILVISFVFPINIFSQDNKQQGHTNTNKFRQLYDEFASPNMFRTASGAPGPAYYQQRADYKINVELDDKNKKLYGDETITYTNNSPETLSYLWVQLDQNVRKKDSPSLDINSEGVSVAYIPDSFDKEFLSDPFDGGFNIEYVKDIDDKPLRYIINQTMMRIDLPNPISTGQSFQFKICLLYTSPSPRD